VTSLQLCTCALLARSSLVLPALSSLDVCRPVAAGHVPCVLAYTLRARRRMVSLLHCWRPCWVLVSMVADTNIPASSLVRSPAPVAAARGPWGHAPVARSVHSPPLALLCVVGGGGLLATPSPALPSAARLLPAGAGRCRAHSPADTGLACPVPVCAAHAQRPRARDSPVCTALPAALSPLVCIQYAPTSARSWSSPPPFHRRCQSIALPPLPRSQVPLAPVCLPALVPSSPHPPLSVTAPAPPALGCPRPLLPAAAVPWPPAAV